MTAALAAEGCGGAMGPSAARVQRVQRVLPAFSGRVQRVVVRRLSGDEFYNFASRNKNQTTGLRPWENHTTALTRAEMHPYPRLRRYFHLKVKRLTTFCASLALLQNVFAVHPGGGSFSGAKQRAT